MNNIIILFSLIIAGFILVYLLLKRQILKRIEPAILIAEIKKELDQVIIEINRTTETNIGLLEDKINTIAELLSKADKRIVLLRRESEKFNLSKDYSQILKRVKTQSQPPVTPVQPEESSVQPSLHDRVLQLHREGFSKSIIANKINVSIGEVELIISLDEAGQVPLDSGKGNL